MRLFCIINHIFKRLVRFTIDFLYSRVCDLNSLKQCWPTDAILCVNVPKNSNNSISIKRLLFKLSNNMSWCLHTKSFANLQVTMCTVWFDSKFSEESLVEKSIRNFFVIKKCLTFSKCLIKRKFKSHIQDCFKIADTYEQNSL